MLKKHKEERNGIPRTSTAAKYTIRTRGKVPADLGQRVSALQAMAILRTINGSKLHDK